MTNSRHAPATLSLILAVPLLCYAQADFRSDLIARYLSTLDRRALSNETECVEVSIAAAVPALDRWATMRTVRMAGSKSVGYRGFRTSGDSGVQGAVIIPFLTLDMKRQLGDVMGRLTAHGFHRWR